MWASLLILSAALCALVDGVCHEYEKDYYGELGCKVESVDTSGCPTSFDCSNMSQRSGDKCHYQGKMYDQGHRLERMPNAECLAECRCAPRYDTGKMAFTCVNIECPELFIGPPPTGCYRTYEHGKCCHQQEICGDEAEKKTPKAVCEYKGETLQVGQKFYPDDAPCLQCICQPGFNGTLSEPFCRKISCNLELVDAAHISEGCAPVYYGENGCCPIDWRCPEDTDAVMSSKTKSNAKSAPDSGKTCKFGNLSMRVGERLSHGGGRGDDTECECRVPPFPVCIQKENS